MSKLLKLKLALLAILTLDSTGKDHDRCLYSVTALRSDFTSSISNIDLVRGTCLLTISRLDVVSFPSNALLWSLSSEATWVVRASSGALVWKTREMWMLPRDVTESFPNVCRRSVRCSLMLCLLSFAFD